MNAFFKLACLGPPPSFFLGRPIHRVVIYVCDTETYVINRVILSEENERVCKAGRQAGDVRYVVKKVDRRRTSRDLIKVFAGGVLQAIGASPLMSPFDGVKMNS